MKGSVIFCRLDAFVERCSDTLDFTRSVLQFRKLAKVDIGGTKGRALSACVAKIHEEFEEVVARFRQVPYDIMDVGEQAFDQDFHQFRLTMKDLDRRLGSVLFAGFDDLDTLQGRVKLLDAFEGLLERPILQAELERKQQALLAQYREDLLEVRCQFEARRAAVDAAREDAPIFANLPPVAGAIYWARSLRSRIREPLAKILRYNGLAREVPACYPEVERLHREVLESLELYERQRYAEWEGEAVDAARQKLSLRLLRRSDRTSLLKVNFDPALVRLLREVHFFLVYDLEVPQAAREMFSRADTYRRWTGQLEHIVELYNAVLTELLPVEEPLLEERIVKMDAALAAGLAELRWRSEDRIPEFIETAMRVVSDVSGVVDVMKGNLRRISRILSEWCKESILERKRGAKPATTEEFDLGHKARVGVRIMSMTERGKEIHKFLKSSSESLKISKTAATWRAYVDFVNNIVIEGFVSAIAVSLQYLCEILDPLIIARHEMLPVFDVRIELREGEIVFDPPFDLEEGPGPGPGPGRTTLRETVDSWLKDFFAMATVMARLDSNVGDYLNEIKEHFQMQCLLALVSELVDNTESKCMEYRETFMRHSFLWADSVEKTFDRFLLEDPHDIVEGVDADGMGFRRVMERIHIDIGPPIPPLERFDREISRFQQMKQDLSGVRTPTDIHWLRINAQPVKVALVSLAQRWEERFTGFLRRFAEERVASLARFLRQARAGLGPSEEEGDPAGAEAEAPPGGPEARGERLLYRTMAHIRDVKLAIDAMGRLFPPIREQAPSALLARAEAYSTHTQGKPLPRVAAAPPPTPAPRPPCRSAAQPSAALAASRPLRAPPSARAHYPSQKSLAPGAPPEAAPRLHQRGETRGARRRPGAVGRGHPRRLQREGEDPAAAEPGDGEDTREDRGLPRGGPGLPRPVPRPVSLRQRARADGRLRQELRDHRRLPHESLRDPRSRRQVQRSRAALRHGDVGLPAAARLPRRPRAAEEPLGHDRARPGDVLGLVRRPLGQDRHGGDGAHREGPGAAAEERPQGAALLAPLRVALGRGQEHGDSLAPGERSARRHDARAPQRWVPV